MRLFKPISECNNRDRVITFNSQNVSSVQLIQLVEMHVNRPLWAWDRFSAELVSVFSISNGKRTEWSPIRSVIDHFRSSILFSDYRSCDDTWEV